MDELPTGTVTLLFSDVGGSTNLVRALGPTWPHVLDRQRALCRAAWSAHAGHELGTEGDSFFVVFATAGDGLRAALDAQHALARESWPLGVDVGARIGIHSGTPQRHGDGYVGLDVHLAARVAAAAHGGQVLASASAAYLAGTDLAGSVQRLDLGEHRLKDIPHRVRLFQVDSAGPRRRFPPVRTQGGAGSLPRPLTPTVGREDELADLAALVDGGARLVTLTGPGGTGKTRLAIAAAGALATRYPDGVFFVPLATARTATDMWGALGIALDVPDELREPCQLLDHLAQRELFLVLDNLEQLDGAAAVTAEVLASGTGVDVITTSRRPLHVPGEHHYAVAPLSVPHTGPVDPTVAQAETAGAVRMFVDHARRTHHGFSLTPANVAAVVGLCRALDGLPLAIEIAASRVKLLSPAAILARVDDSLDLAGPGTGGDPRRHTVRQTIAWSYELLDERQQSLLDHLGVFEGQADLAAVSAVTGEHPARLLDLLYDLVDASLVRVTDGDDHEPRFTLLETIKRFARDRMRSTMRWEAAEAAHAQHYFDVSLGLRARDEEGEGTRGDVLSRLDEFRLVLERGARGVTAASRGDAAVPPGHVATLLIDRAKAVGAGTSVIESWVRLALELPGVGADSLVTATLLLQRGEFHYTQAHSQQALRDLQDAQAAVRSARAVEAQPAWLSPDRIELDLLARQVFLHLGYGDVSSAAAVQAQMAEPASRLGVPGARTRLWAEQSVCYGRGDLEQARHALEQWTDLGSSPPLTAREQVMFANNLADLEVRLGQRGRARQRLVEATDAALTLANPFVLRYFASTFAFVVGAQHPLLFARVHASVATLEEAEGIPNTALEEAEGQTEASAIRRLVSAEDWAESWERGRTEGILDLIAEMAALPVS